MSIAVSTNLDYLIDYVRLRIGDTNPASYRYTDEWLRTALVGAVKLLTRWWNYKYLITTDGTYNIYRNPNGYFVFDEATYGIIEQGDEQVIVLMASFLTLQGSLESSAWSTGAWRDAEISYSNIEGGRMRTDILKGIWTELTSTLKVPSKRLARAIKMSLPGFLDNQYERDVENLG